MTGRTSIRVVKRAAIVFATFGLAILWFVATRTEVPTIAVGQLDAMMNLAYVGVEGRCIRPPSYDPETEYLGFWVADETGEIHVVAYRTQTRSLIEQHRLPGLGDQVAVTGTLRIREAYRSLTLDTPQQLTIRRSQPVTCSISSISPMDRFRRVRVRGQVRQIVHPYPGLMLVALRDQTGTIDVALSDDLIALSPVTPTLETGQPLEVVAAVSEYEGTAQLVPASAADVVPVDDEVPIAARRFVSELSAGRTGEWVLLRGTIVDLVPFSSGVKLALDDGSGVTTLLLWQDLYEDLENVLDAGLALGAEIEVQGRLAEYRGQLEVIPELATDVRILAAATPESRITSVDALTAEDVGRQVVLRGTLGPPDPFSAGMKYPLSDQTGTITLLLWDEVYDSLPSADALTVGTLVEVIGEIDQYRGDLEIIPGANGVKLLEQ